MSSKTLHTAVAPILTLILTLALSACTLGRGTPLLAEVSIGGERELNYYDLLVRTSEERKIDRKIKRSIKKWTLRQLKLEQLPWTQLWLHVYNGTVLIVGYLPDLESIRQIEEEAQSTAQVRRVHNFISSQPTLSSEGADGWITLQAKLSLAELPNNLQGRTKIVTFNGVVYILGLIEEREKISLIRAVQGASQVHKVVFLTEVLD